MIGDFEKTFSTLSAICLDDSTQQQPQFVAALIASN